MCEIVHYDGKLLWMIDNQLGRCTLTDYQRRVLACIKGLHYRARQGESDPGEPFCFGEISKTNASDVREEFAKVAGMSHGAVAKVEKIQAQAVAGFVAVALNAWNLQARRLADRSAALRINDEGG